MLKSKVAVQVMSAGIIPDDALMLGESHLKRLKIPLGQSIMLSFGSYRQQVKVIPVQRYDGMRINQTLAKRMGLFTGTPLRLKYRAHEGVLAMGPLIGVLISRDNAGQSDKPFGAITLFCKELVDACRAQGAYVYFFTPDQIGGSTSSVQAWVYSSGWKRMQMPVADVINNRLTSRKLENKPSVQHFLKEVKSRYRTQVFNEKFLDKSEVFDALKNDSSLLRYLPESYSLQNFKTLKSMCTRHPTIFLKPVRGSLGKGIIRISRLEGGSYQALYATVGGSKRQVFSNLTKLFASLSGKIKTVRYQIQQGLQLIEIQKRPVDFRALVQKNATGAWGLTSNVARIAGSQHFVSNLARGGTLTKVKEAVLKSNLSAAAKGDAAAKLQRAALEIAKGIERYIPAHFGELGIDLALDTSGRVWLLEVNSKPSKNDNTPLNDQKIRPSVKFMIQYARYLSGF
ncbi:YheC/YheD family protein [Paenibacillaceae bacterium]|nr:YheC/YheD family protein [Paenibacillaceae bacterium]